MVRRWLWRMFVRDLFFWSVLGWGRKRGREDLTTEIIAMRTGMMDNSRDACVLGTVKEALTRVSPGRPSPLTRDHGCGAQGRGWLYEMRLGR